MPLKATNSRRARLARIALVGSLVSPLFFVAACQSSPSIMNPASPSARIISDLGWQLFAVAAVVFVAVEAVLIYAVIRFRNKGSTEEPRQVYGHTRLEIVWTAAPGLVLIGVLYTMFQAMATLLPIPQDAMPVKVIGHQWWWEVEYPEHGIATANELHFPVGRPVRVDLQAADVIHSFWVSELGPKMDLLPEQVNSTWYKVERPGVYRGFCAEFCGVQHANMGFIVVAEEQGAFDAWVQAQRQPATAPADPLAQQGAQAFTTSGCAGCHAIAGTPAQARIGPNLSHVGSRRYIGANALANTPENMAAWITNPQEAKPGNLMPALPLDPERVRQLTAYLVGLK